MPDGSKIEQRPSCERLGKVACKTSGLLDAVSTAASKLGTTNEDVLPERGGPRTSSACWDPVQISRCRHRAPAR